MQYYKIHYLHKYGEGFTIVGIPPVTDSVASFKEIKDIIESSTQPQLLPIKIINLELCTN